MSRILIIEDEELLGLSYARLFRAHGHECICVDTAERGLERVKQEPWIEVLIVDLELRKGELCGLDVLRVADQFGCHPVPIVISGHSLQEVNSRVAPLLNPFLQGQAWFYFAKPIVRDSPDETRSLERLLAIVAAAGRR